MLTKVLVAIGLILLVMVLLFAVKRGPSSGGRSQAKARETYLDLRNLMLAGSRAKFSLPPPSSATEPWGVLMDWNVTNGTATIVAMSDGSASIYLSSGGGFLGGKGQEPIRRAAVNAVRIAAGAQSQMVKTETFPLPDAGQVRFYTLTDSGVYTVSASEVDLKKGTSPLSDLGNAMQGVITEYRVFQQKQQAPQS